MPKNPMNYGKARGAFLLKKFLPPDVVPFSEIDLISTEEEWEAVKDKYGSYAFQRVDWPINAVKPDKFYGTSGRPEDIPGLLKATQEDNPDAAILLMLTKGPKRYRYEYDGGFNVLFALDKEIVIEIVGKAFDGHEITQGLAVHERYTIPWEFIVWTNDRKALPNSAPMTPELYAGQRKERVRYLTEDCKYDAELVEKSVPTKFEPISDSLFKELLDHILIEILLRKNDLRREGLELFCVQGNFVDGRVQPWELFVPNRW